MLDHPTLAVAVIRKGRIGEHNAAWATAFALRPDISVESHLIGLFPSANSADRFNRALRGAHAPGTRLGRVEHMLLRRDGVPFMAEVVVHGLDDQAAALTLDADAIWQVRDITAERELRRELRELEEYYRALSTYQCDLTFVVDKKDCISFASPSVESALGHKPHSLLGEPFVSLLAPDGANAGMQWLRAARAAAEGDRPQDSCRLRVRDRDGDERVLSCRLRNCLDVPRIMGLVINARDVTEEACEEGGAQESQQRAVKFRERLFQLATAPAERFEDRIPQLLQAACEGLEAAAASYWESTESGAQVCNHSFLTPTDFLAIDPCDVRDPYGEIFDTEGAPRYARELETLRPIVVPDITRHELIDDDHRDALVKAGIGALLDFPVVLDGKRLGVVSIAHARSPRIWKSDEIDFAGGISLLTALAIGGREREESAGRMAHMALHDGLTGLSNRTSAERELEQRIAGAAAGTQALVVAMIDLDQFKEINVAHGHAMGDALLVAVAKTLVDVVGGDALIARMGGDEFLVALEESAVSDSGFLVKRMLDRLSDRSMIPGIEQPLGVSIGVARFPKDGGDAEAMLLAADLAMCEAKSRGRGQAFTFDGRLAERIRLRRELDSEIQNALANDEFCMFYQPQLEFESGRVIGLEALLRWQHPRHGLLLPDAFIAAALHRGMVDVLTKWVLTQVCEQINTWYRSDPDAAIPISINMSERQLHDRRLPALVAGALMKNALPARLLMLEVTEESLVNDEAATDRVLKELGRLGTRISVSGFGSTLGSLVDMNKRSVSQVKLDRRFVAGLPKERVSDIIVGAIIEAAAELECQLVAEGVETREQFEHLRARGCAAGQGFFFGAPLSAEETARFLQQRRSADPPADESATAARASQEKGNR